MRSRTELVTTTFVDSEEEFSEDDDSEEDWRPTASSANKNGRKAKHARGGGAAGGGSGAGGTGGGRAKRGRKRKGATAAARRAAAKRKPTYAESDEDNDDEPSDDNPNQFDDHEVARSSVNKKITPATAPAVADTTIAASATTSATQKKQLPEVKAIEQTFADTTAEDTLELLLYKRDLIGDYSRNGRLCLWRRDDNNLLQKYIRVKTIPNDFLFTSSSVYSSWDDKRICDFANIKVKCMDPNNRRVRIINTTELQQLSQEATEKAEAENSDNEEGYKKPQDASKTQGEVEINSDDSDYEESAPTNIPIKTARTTVANTGAGINIKILAPLNQQMANKDMKHNDNTDENDNDEEVEEEIEEEDDDDDGDIEDNDDADIEDEDEDDDDN
ncbi:chromatin-remodeling ATPase INO80 [Teleopsis dalmanni]|uniref:chromatin-remodeling ATPase INO80 n=1 Tax=Teleopsis dalmanni TaxID=139649 RepID=UPI0018CD468A|nr:chromatin-remodeling ATPase INO80 [Teleopsis dalmanni]